ncbi:MAG: winged helix-turn-helix transcriptional regulator [Rhodospirillaceae bacterium]|jgi:DNA-binding MarR family transcriptional regulator|nr:winged helix-turn-helix transcriptional regulator [Rhodospirillaceae bacterium]MBT5194921.1 winged helix-turn-helix transcriptional regulator [Rhodospirillaceae bacterium]MBT5896598.1 winged helix-turn-helix transcriptional regulator [Rhodospirillaceae bacterium]MBT6426113.1 winged helix-turn-helix transcriptional regulator [Rhodospirillaceae bacterium]
MSSEQTVDETEISTDGIDGEARITMEMLHAVDGEESLSQRGLAARLNIALGLTNAYLKRCVRMGLVKVRKTPPNRYAYYLTPKGFGEKSRLTANYLFRSFDFYRRARNQCDDLLGEAADTGRRRVALVGAGELAEIALLCALQHDIEVVGVADEGATANRFRHVDLVRDAASLPAHDLVLICDLADPQGTFEKLSGQFDPETIIAPALLKISVPSNPPESAP